MKAWGDDEQRRAEKSEEQAKQHREDPEQRRGRAVANDSRVITQKTQEQGEARKRTKRTAKIERTAQISKMRRK